MHTRPPDLERVSWSVVSNRSIRFPRQRFRSRLPEKALRNIYLCTPRSKYTRTCSFTSWREREKTRKVGCEYTVSFSTDRDTATHENDLLGRKEVLQLATAVLGLEVGAACAYPETQQERSAKPPAASKRGKSSDRAGWIRSVGEDAPPMNSPLMKIEGTVDWPVFWARYACRGGFG